MSASVTVTDGIQFNSSTSYGFSLNAPTTRSTCTPPRRVSVERRGLVAGGCCGYLLLSVEERCFRVEDAFNVRVIKVGHCRRRRCCRHPVASGWSKREARVGFRLS